MDGPKDPIDELGLVRSLFQLQKGPVELGEVFLHLFLKKGAGFGVKYHPFLPSEV